MQYKTKRRWRKITTGILLYLFFCVFLWNFLLVRTRSYNRLAHEPVAMAQLTIQPDNTAELALADASYSYALPSFTGDVCLWISLLPDFAGDTAVLLWQALWDNMR